MWVLRWQVKSHSDPARRYTVAVDEHGAWGCDCPQGKFHRDRGPCKHVKQVQAGQAKATRLPAQDPGGVVRTPPSVSVPAATGARLRNVKEVYAELKEEPEVSADGEAAPLGSTLSNLLAALDD